MWTCFAVGLSITSASSHDGQSHVRRSCQWGVGACGYVRLTEMLGHQSQRYFCLYVCCFHEIPQRVGGRASLSSAPALRSEWAGD